jgi:hypothetical protein
MYFWSQDKMPMSYDQLKERFRAQILYHVNKCRVTYFAMCFQCGLNTLLLNLQFKAIFFDFQVNSEHKHWTESSVCHV